MAFLIVFKNLLIALAVTFVITFGTPIGRFRTWQMGALLFFIGFSVGIYYARKNLDKEMRVQAARVEKDQRDQAAFRYLLNDLIPAKRLVGGGVPEDINQLIYTQLERGTPCMKALAFRYQGYDADIDQACGERS